MWKGGHSLYTILTGLWEMNLSDTMVYRATFDHSFSCSRRLPNVVAFPGHRIKGYVESQHNRSNPLDELAKIGGACLSSTASLTALLQVLI